MTYKFKCKECGNIQYIDIKMSDYDELKNKQKCEKCNSKMERVIEFEGAIGATGGYDLVGGMASWQG